MAVSVKEYKNTGLKFIRGTMKTLFEKGGVLVNNEDFDDWDRRGVVMAQVLGLGNHPKLSGHDFSYTVETGMLSQHGVKLERAPMPAFSAPLVDEERQEQSIEEIVASIESHPLVQTESLAVQRVMEAIEEVGEQQAATLPKLENMLDEHLDSLNSRPELGEDFPGFVPVDTSLLREPALAEEQKKKVSLVGIHTSRDVMIWVMLIVGVGSLFMSGYHIVRYLEEARGWTVAIITGIIMSLFSAAAFTTGRYFWFLTGAKNKIIAGTFWAFGLGCVIFAMFATMTVNYDDFRAMSDTKVATAVQNSTAVKATASQDSRLQTEYDRITKELDQTDKDNQPFKDTVSGINRKLNDPILTDEQRQQLRDDRDSAQYRINVNENKVKADRAALSGVRDKLFGSSDNAVQAEDKVVAEEEKGTLFGALHDLFGWRIDTMKLIVYVIPAIFYDIMSPFALTIVLILEEKREEDEDNA